MVSGRGLINIAVSEPQWPAAGIRRDQVAQLAEVLAGVSYPVQKWQLIEYAVAEMRAERGSVDRQIADRLWALPPGCYTDFGQVLLGTAGPGTTRSTTGRACESGGDEQPARRANSAASRAGLEGSSSDGGRRVFVGVSSSLKLI